MLKLAKFRLFIITGFIVAIAVLSLVIFHVGYLFTQPLSLSQEGYELYIAEGDSLSRIATELTDKKIIRYPKKILSLYARLTGTARQIQAGEYRVPHGTNSIELLDMLRQGRVIQHTITFIEGWTVKDVLIALRQHPKIKSDLVDVKFEDLLAFIERPGKYPEGLFFPDTYYFTAYTSDKEILQRAYDAMRLRLMKLWRERSPESQMLSPYQTLVLASIVEKETALVIEMPMVSGVYLRRLQKNMPLQADPTVIYGMGDKFQGRLMSEDLKFDSPYNTYLKRGLPPTPIALPSLAAIDAILHPKEGQSLYFVADGQGGHIFSVTYEEHLKAVDQLNALRKKHREQLEFDLTKSKDDKNS